jgi:hypothetical protein
MMVMQTDYLHRTSMARKSFAATMLDDMALGIAPHCLGKISKVLGVRDFTLNSTIVMMAIMQSCNPAIPV